MTGLEGVFVGVACTVVGYGMRSEIVRVFGKPKSDCPFGDACVYCHPRTTTNAKVHMMVTESSSWVQV